MLQEEIKVQEGDDLFKEDLAVKSTDTRGGYVANSDLQLVRLPQLEGKLLRVPLNLVVPNSDQPRKYFDKEEMNRLRESIKLEGQRCPINVVPAIRAGARFAVLFVIEGERRLKVLQELGEPAIKVLIEWVENADALFIRSFLLNTKAGHNPIEKAIAYNRMIRFFSTKNRWMDKTDVIKKVASVIGCGTVLIYNYLRLLKLPKQVQQLIMENQLPLSGSLQLANAVKKYGNLIEPLKLARLILDKPDTDFERLEEKARTGAEEKIEQTVPPHPDRGRVTAASVRERVQTVLVTEGKIDSKEAAQLEIDARVIAFVAEIRQMIRRTDALLIPNVEIPRAQITKTFRERRGYPPEVVFEILEELLGKLRKLYTLIIKPAILPPPLKIPKDAPKFFAQITKYSSRFTKKQLQIVVLLAKASDNEGELHTVEEIAEALRISNSLEISNILKSVGMRELLGSCDLRLDIHEKKKRVQRPNRDPSLETFTGYRLAWLTTRSK